MRTAAGPIQWASAARPRLAPLAPWARWRRRWCCWCCRRSRCRRCCRCRRCRFRPSDRPAACTPAEFWQCVEGSVPEAGAASGRAWPSCPRGWARPWRWTWTWRWTRRPSRSRCSGLRSSAQLRRSLEPAPFKKLCLQKCVTCILCIFFCPT